jgi:uncharacterized protein YodC (DUF2158 family)
MNRIETVELRIGDIVRLNSGGPNLTVVDVGKNGDVSVNWVAPGTTKYGQATFPRACFKFAER